LRNDLEPHGSMVIFVATGFWWAVFLALHVLQPGLDPIRAPGSAYVLGEYGIWARASYFAIAAALLSAGFSLGSRLGMTAAARRGRLAFCISAAAAVLAAIFPIDYPGPPRTFSGILHAIGGGVGFLSWVSGTLLFTVVIRRDPGWRGARSVVTVLAGLCLLVIGVAIGAMIILGFAGFVQRILLAVLFSWLLVVALHLRHSARHSVTQPVL
jgi:hypothetical protein